MVLDATKRIEKLEKRIFADERKILIKEERIDKLLQEQQQVLNDFKSAQSKFISRLSRHKLFFGIISTIGVVLVWRGLTLAIDATPILSHFAISILVGLLLLWMIKYYTTRK